MTRRGQSSTEYLIILGVVIIIALIVVGVLGGIPGIGTGSRHRASENYWITAEIAIPSHSIDSEGTSNIYGIRNNLQHPITLTSILLDSTELLSSSVSLAPGESTVLHAGNLANQLDCGDPEDFYFYGVTISYTSMLDGTDHVFTGGNVPLEGKCARG